MEDTLVHHVYGIFTCVYIQWISKQKTSKWDIFYKGYFTIWFFVTQSGNSFAKHEVGGLTKRLWPLVWWHQNRTIPPYCWRDLFVHNEYVGGNLGENWRTLFVTLWNIWQSNIRPFILLTPVRQSKL